MASLADPEGGQGVRSSPLPAPVIKYPMKMKYFDLTKYPMKVKLFGLSETKLFHLLGIFKKNEIKLELRGLFKYECK